MERLAASSKHACTTRDQSDVEEQGLGLYGGSAACWSGLGILVSVPTHEIVTGNVHSRVSLALTGGGGGSAYHGND